MKSRAKELKRGQATIHQNRCDPVAHARGGEGASPHLCPCSDGNRKDRGRQLLLSQQEGLHAFRHQGLSRPDAPVGSIEEDTVVIDDMSFIVDTQSQDYVKGLIRSGEKHLVMLGRCVMPH